MTTNRRALETAGRIPGENAFSGSVKNVAPRVETAIIARAVLSGRTVFELRLNEDRVYSLGRDAPAQLRIEDASVSRQHGVLRFVTDQGWTFTDANSTNGTVLSAGELDGDGFPPSRRKLRGTSAAVNAGDVLFLGTERCRLELLPGKRWRPAGPRSTTESLAGRNLEAFLDRVAPSRAPVFFLGRTGTGKSHAAGEVHRRSGRAGQFVPVNCASLPTDRVMLQSILLGHAAGAYTGATQAAKGRFFAADDGTLFLDEVESLTAEAQGFLLDVLEGQGAFLPLGVTVKQKAPQFRLITASKVQLNKSGLRQDLCHRLLAGEIHELPALERRREDIPGFMDLFAADEARREGFDGVISFLPDAEQWACQEAHWPGQVRELESTVRAAVREALRLGARHGVVSLGAQMLMSHADLRIQALGSITTETPTSIDLRPVVVSPPPAPVAARSTHQLTAEDLREALAQENGNLARTARRLGIALNTLKRKLERFGLR